MVAIANHMLTDPDNERVWRPHNVAVLIRIIERGQEMLHTIDWIALQQLDNRVLEYLSERSKITNSKELNCSHQSIARDLNSSREVISRVLKILEKRELLELGRNKIRINAIHIEGVTLFLTRP